MTDDLNIFSKMDSPVDELQEKSIGTNKYVESKRKIRDICVSIALPSEEYNPKTIVDLMDEYINDKQFLNRILYSEVSGFIYGLEDLSLEIFLSNIDTLQSYVSDTQNLIDTKIQNTIIKLCDHAALASQQKTLLSNERIANITDAQSVIENKYELLKSNLQELTDKNFNVSKSLEEAKNKYFELNEKLDKTEKEYTETVKQTQKDYISIFGVFSAIIISFVGGLSFTTSVMNGINLASRYRIVFIVSLIGYVVINLIHYLVEFLTRISEPFQKSNIIQKHEETTKSNKIKIFFANLRLKRNNLRKVNIILVGILIIDTILFFLDEGAEYFERIIDSIKNIIDMF